MYPISLKEIMRLWLGLKITPQDPVVPEALIDQAGNLLPRIKITELLRSLRWPGRGSYLPGLQWRPASFTVRSSHEPAIVCLSLTRSVCASRTRGP
jgi:hypothetical protein